MQLAQSQNGQPPAAAAGSAATPAAVAIPQVAAAAPAASHKYRDMFQASQAAHPSTSTNQVPAATGKGGATLSAGAAPKSGGPMSTTVVAKPAGFVAVDPAVIAAQQAAADAAQEADIRQNGGYGG